MVVTYGSVTVSVIMPAYNEASTITACIESLLFQDYHGSYEIIVVNDGSTDTIMLEKGEKWQQAITFSPLFSGIDQKLEVVLYKDKELYHSLHFWVDVSLIC